MSFISAEKIAHAGIFVVAGVIFAESGLMVGFFLPGDSLLFTAGFLASQGFVNVHLLAGTCFIAAVIGDSVGYAFGKRVGPRLLKRPDGKIFKQKYIAQAEAFFEEHGKKTIILARFVPIVRTFSPIVAGLGSMNYRTFLSYNVIGGALWTLGITYLGYFLGNFIPKDYLEPAIILVVLISLLPAFHHFLKEAENRQKVKKLPALTIKKIRSIIKRSE
ncbi:MAG: VTT domain-containing protein [Candidatus Saccharimonadales bacterium]